MEKESRETKDETTDKKDEHRYWNLENNSFDIYTRVSKIDQ